MRVARRRPAVRRSGASGDSTSTRADRRDRRRPPGNTQTSGMKLMRVERLPHQHPPAVAGAVQGDQAGRVARACRLHARDSAVDDALGVGSLPREHRGGHARPSARSSRARAGRRGRAPPGAPSRGPGPCPRCATSERAASRSRASRRGNPGPSSSTVTITSASPSIRDVDVSMRPVAVRTLRLDRLLRVEHQVQERLPHAVPGKGPVDRLRSAGAHRAVTAFGHPKAHERAELFDHARDVDLARSGSGSWRAGAR